MKNATYEAFTNTGRFQMMQAETSQRNHLMDVSDMLWQSGETSLLDEMYSLVDTDYLVYGRVFGWDATNRVIQIELTMLHVKSKRKISSIGNGANGSLQHAVNDAVQKIDSRLDELGSWNR